LEGLFGGTVRIVVGTGGLLAEFGSDWNRLESATISGGAVKVVSRSDNVTLAQLEGDFYVVMIRPAAEFPPRLESLRIESVDPRISFKEQVRLEWRDVQPVEIELLHLPSPALITGDRHAIASGGPDIMISGPHRLTVGPENSIQLQNQ